MVFISNEFRITFDKSGTIQSINTFIYGKNDDGDKKTYLIDYNADKSSNMIVWSDGNVNDGYSKYTYTSDDADFKKFTIKKLCR